MSNEVFDVKVLAEKLSKLNNSQQSIESLSKWCITHRKKARQIVETWEKMFNSSQKEQCVSFLYLANDILQNSRRKGSEFVNEFWKVLPGALKHVYDTGDESGKKAATRLVDIWEERKVFGSRVQSLKDELVANQGKDPAPQPQAVSNGKSTNPIKLVKKDAQSLRIKLAVGGFPEKIVSAFHCLHDDCSNEDSALAKCNAAVLSVESLVKDLESTIAQGAQVGDGIAAEMQDQESILQYSVKELEVAQASRVALVDLLKEALLDQEAKLETLHCQLQIARSRINEVELLKPKVSLQKHGLPAADVHALNEAPNMGELIKSSVQGTSSLQILPGQPIGTLQPPVNQVPQPPKPATSFASVVTTDEESKKAAAAAVAAKLAASTSSAQMLTSVLSSLVAEEAASMTDNMRNVGFSAGLPMFPPEKRQKVENPSSGANVAITEVGSSPFFTPLQKPISSMPVSQGNQIQTSMAPPPPPPPPPPPLMPSNPASNQFVQSAGMMLNMMPPYGFGGNSLPPPPLPSHLPMGLPRPPTSQCPQPLQPSQQPAQQQTVNGGYYRPPGIGIYGSSTQPSTPPVHRQ